MIEPVPENSTPLTLIGKRSIRLALLILPIAALANIGFFLWSMGDRPLLSLAVEPHWLIVALLFTFLPWVTNTLRLLIWSRFFNLGLSPPQAVRIILGTVLGNAVTPTATGAPAVKWAFMVNEDVTPDKATTLIGLQTAEDGLVSMTLLAGALIAAVSLDIPAMFPDIDWIDSGTAILKNIATAVLVVAAIASVFLVGASIGLIGSKMRSLARSLFTRIRAMLANAMTDWQDVLRTGRKFLFVSIALAVVQWTTRHSIATLIIGFVGAQMMPMLHWALQWLVFTASSIAPTPGGAGGTEAAFLLFFAPFLSSDLLSPAMVIWRITIFYIPVVIAGLIFLSLRWHRPIGST